VQTPRRPPPTAAKPAAKPAARIPGPAGAIEQITERVMGWGGNGLDGPVPLTLSQAPKDYGCSGFVRSAAWMTLDGLMRGDGGGTPGSMSFAGRQTLRDVRVTASLGVDGRPPAAAVRTQTLCVVVAALDNEGSGAENVRATLVDETDECAARTHAPHTPTCRPASLWSNAHQPAVGDLPPAARALLVRASSRVPALLRAWLAGWRPRCTRASLWTIRAGWRLALDLGSSARCL
jgi:hypothetical protein